MAADNIDHCNTIKGTDKLGFFHSAHLTFVPSREQPGLGRGGWVCVAQPEQRGLYSRAINIMHSWLLTERIATWSTWLQISEQLLSRVFKWQRCRMYFEFYTANIFPRTRTNGNHQSVTCRRYLVYASNIIRKLAQSSLLSRAFNENVFSPSLFRRKCFFIELKFFAHGNHQSVTATQIAFRISS